MPLYLDIHRNIDGLTREAVHDAHRKDLEIQGAHDVEYLKYWYNEDEGAVFCLVRAPDRESARAVHRKAHGLVADEIVEVQEGT
jgi:hypothetical protein